MDYTLNNIDLLPKTANDILQVCKAKRIFALYGEMGSGKTTMIKEFCKQLGSIDSFSSPTYSIVNEYHLPDSERKIYHMDLYRLRNIEEAIALGIEDYLSGYDYCFIEWPELVEALLPIETVKISITAQQNIRNVSIFMG